jgi:hypothetical protein
MEAINSLVQAAKAKARGYRSMRNLKAIIYLIAGKLELALHETAKSLNLKLPLLWACSST